MPGSDPEHQGHLGDLHTRPTAELMDLLRRQESILQKQNFLRSLPDGGRKVRAFADTLHRIITERKRQEIGQVSETVGGMGLDTPLIKSDKSLGGSEAQKPARPPSQFSKLRDKQRATEALNPANNNSVPDTEICMRVGALSMKEETTKDNDGHLSQLINTAYSQKVYLHGEHPAIERETVNSYLKVMQKSEQASASTRQHFKPNSSLKIKSLQELPDEYRGKGASRREVLPMEADQRTYGLGTTALPSSSSEPSPKSAVAESSAIPPNYKYDQVKVITLDESFQLQKSQAVKQEELRAQHAAERLAGKIHVKMGPYNPEGNMSMAYRSQNDSEDELDSDDQDEDYPE